jgi:hypothetical protein
MSDKQPEADSGQRETRERLQALRKAVLDLHKTLVDSERLGYEKHFGAIQSPNQFLQLLIQDPWFGWLQPLSLLIVSMDEALDAREPLTTEAVESLTREATRLLVAEEKSEGFPGHYFEALQRDPDVVLAHAEVTKLTGTGGQRRA